MLRYYGIYAKHHKQEKKLRKCLSPEKRDRKASVIQNFPVPLPLLF